MNTVPDAIDILVKEAREVHKLVTNINYAQANDANRRIYTHHQGIVTGLLLAIETVNKLNISKEETPEKPSTEVIQ